MKILFVAPISGKHGEGIIGSISLSALHDRPNTDILLVDSHINGSWFIPKLFNVMLLYVNIIKLSFQKKEILYLSLGRTINTNIRDFIAVITTKLRNPKCRVILHIHGSEISSCRSNFQKLWYLVISKICHRAIILSSTHSCYTFGEDFQKYRIIPNPIITNCVPVNTENETQTHGVRFLFVSNPIASKGLDTAIDIFNSCSISVEDTLTVVGWTKDDYLRVYKPKILSNCSKINFLGKVYGDDKDKIFQNSDVFLFPTRYKTETQPLVLIEALYYNQKIITSRLKILDFFEQYQNHFYIDTVDNYTTSQRKLTHQLTGQDLSNFNRNHNLDHYKSRIIDAIFT